MHNIHCFRRKPAGNILEKYKLCVYILRTVTMLGYYNVEKRTKK